MSRKAHGDIERHSHKGWFRVEEQAVRRLRDTYDVQSTYRLAFLVYVTLCRVANLEGSDTFTRRIASIAGDAGLSYNATAEGLELVRTAELVTITARTVSGSKERAPSEYRLERTSPVENGTFPTEKGRLPQSCDSQVLPRVSKNAPRTSKNSIKKHDFKKTSTSFLQNDASNFLKRLDEEFISEERKEFIRKFNEYAESNPRALLPVDVYSPEVDRSLDIHEDDAFEDLSKLVAEQVENFKDVSGKRLTLVRIIQDGR
jgi:hypothetical protein